MFRQNKKAFTLVELIVTIAILAILGTIAYISIQSYSKSARDSVRISDLNSMKTSLELFNITSGKYPIPTDGESVTYSGSKLWTQGVFGDTVLTNVRNLNKLPIDPLNGSKYTYSVLNTGGEYELGAVSEGGELGYNNSLIKSTYAYGSNIIESLIVGTYNGAIVKTSTGNIDYILAIPSIINGNMGLLDIITILEQNKLSYNGYDSLPDSYRGTKLETEGLFEYNPLEVIVYKGDIKDLYVNETLRVHFLKKIQEAYSGITLGNSIIEDIKLKDLDVSNPSVSSRNLAINIVNNYLNGKIGADQAPLAAGCTIDGLNINHGESITAYSEKNILWDASYSCTYRQEIRTCEEGVLSGTEINQYVTCIKGIADDCSTTTQSGYTIPSMNHSDVLGITKTEVVLDGVEDFTADALCFDGNINISGETKVLVCDTDYHNEANICVSDTRSCTIINGIGTQTWSGISWTPCTVVSCNTGYHQDGNTCISDAQVVICGGIIVTNATASTATTYTQTWDGTIWTPTTSWGENQTTCDYNCDTNYTWNGTSCEADTKTFTCAAKSATGTLWNTVDQYLQIWDGIVWIPSDSITEYNIIASTTSCNYKCDTNYTWNGTSCEADIKIFTCSAKPVVGTIWNTVDNYIQTWNGYAWSPIDSTTEYNTTASTASCVYKCDINYTWNGTSCIADTQVVTCSGSIISNATATTSTNYTQIWNGSIWTPTVYWGENQATCDFDCDTNYTWNGSSCEANTQVVTCGGSIVSNATASTTTDYTQTWNGTIWTPTTAWGENQATCDFDCNLNYTWNGTSCEADTQIVACGGSIITNATASTSINYTQTWNGSIWTPTTAWGENQATCDFDCNLNYTWNGTSCEADGQSCTITNGTGTQTWNGSSWSTCTVVTCNTDFYNPGNNTCSAVGTGYYSANLDTTRSSCTNKPTNSNYTSDGNGTNNCSRGCITDFYWDGANCSAVGIGYYSANNDNTGTACTNKPANSTYTSDGNGTNNCSFSCNTNYTWNGSSCLADTQTYSCTAKPVTGTTWNTVSSYIQTWNGSSWSPIDSTTVYNTTSSSTSCRYKCDTNYTWNGSSCAADSQSCTITNGTGTQTWNGSSWSTCTVVTCNTDFYNPGNNTCSAVGNGYYSNSTSTSRTACTNYPDNTSRDYTYTSDGNGTNSCTASYTDKCGIDLYETSNGVCSAVGIGYYSANLNNSRPACTNKPANSTYTSDGNGANNCSFSCNTNYTWNGSICESDSTPLTISSNTANYNIATALGNPATAINVTLTINSGITVYSTSTSNAALSTGSLPAGSTVKIINNGSIIGMGGTGGSGGGGGSAGNAGVNGGNAINLNFIITLDNTNGYIYGGGGGGGGGAGAFDSSFTGLSGGGGGGGGGAGNSISTGGAGGVGNSKTGNPGNGGTTSGGIGGTGVRIIVTTPASGGNGGGYGLSGGNGGASARAGGGLGGAAGKAIALNGKTINWLGGNNGTQVKGSVN